jgi:hypothetical protein
MSRDRDLFGNPTSKLSELLWEVEIFGAQILTSPDYDVFVDYRLEDGEGLYRVTTFIHIVGEWTFGLRLGGSQITSLDTTNGPEGIEVPRKACDPSNLQIEIESANLNTIVEVELSCRDRYGNIIDRLESGDEISLFVRIRFHIQ